MSGKREYEIILQHGWGLSSSCWNDWVDILKGYGRILTPDRGYFKNRAVIDDFKTDGKRVLISHSFGLYLFPESLLNKADYLIIISGFTRFHPEDKREKRRSSMLMRFMRKKLEEQPEKLLLDFYNGHDLRGEKDLNPVKDILAEDLRAIDEDEPDMESIKKIKNILIVHGDKDMVVPLSRAEYLNKILPKSKLAIFEKEDHALPFTKPEEVIDLIMEYLEKGEVCGKYTRAC